MANAQSLQSLAQGPPAQSGQDFFAAFSARFSFRVLTGFFLVSFFLSRLLAIVALRWDLWGGDGIGFRAGV